MLDDDKDSAEGEQGNSQDTDSSEASGRIWALRSEAEARRVADSYASLKTPQMQRRKLLQRIMVSPEQIPAIALTLVDALHRAEVQTKHDFLDLFLRVVVEGGDLAPIAESISKLMLDANFGLREKAAALLIRMGPAANGAVLRTVGMLRSKMSDVQVNALRLLGAIGPICAKVAIPKIEMMLRGNLDKDVLVEARETMRILRGETPPEVETQKVEQVVQESAQHSEESARRQYVNIQGRSILVVDDDQGIRRMVSNALLSHGAQVLEAANGREALELLKSGRVVDLLLVDLLMPEMNGAEMLRVVREDRALQKLPVYVISARTERALLLAMAKLGVAGYFMKPFKLQEILDRVNSTFAS